MLAYQGNGCHSLGIELLVAGFLGAGRLLNGRMIYKVCAFYQFAALPDYRELREPLRALCAGLSLKGSVLLAQEGINGTIAGAPEAVDAFAHELAHGVLFGGRLNNLELKFSTAEAMPFGRLKVRLKKEIVTLGDAAADPTRQVGTYVEAAEWNALIASPDTLVLDTRNAFEVAMGTFEGAVDPRIKSFGLFNHLKGGILKYLEQVPEAQSRWRGECFVFDERVALGHGLRERGLREQELGHARDE
jgi:UPF0176 protein